MIIQDKNKLKEYIDIVQKVAKVEQRRIPSHMVEYEELVSIGIIAIQVLIKNKSPEQLERYNAAYIATAGRWEIRNELRIRYKCDNDSPFDFLKDTHAQPDENAEISEMGRMIREAIAKLPPKERTVVEYRFYRNMQVKDIARQVGLSPSRVTRIVQSSLNSVKEYLNSKEQYGY